MDTPAALHADDADTRMATRKVEARARGSEMKFQARATTEPACLPLSTLRRGSPSCEVLAILLLPR